MVNMRQCKIKCKDCVEWGKKIWGFGETATWPQPPIPPQLPGNLYATGQSLGKLLDSSTYKGRQ